MQDSGLEWKYRSGDLAVLQREADESVAFHLLQKAIDLDPDDKQYSLALAQFQIHRVEYTSAQSRNPTQSRNADKDVG